MKKIILMLLVAFTLVGCGGTETIRYQVVESKKLIMVKPDDALLLPCHESEPPKQDVYIAANRDKKEALLTSYIASLLSDNKRCSLDKLTLQKTIERQESYIQKTNDEEAARVEELLKSKGATPQK